MKKIATLKSQNKSIEEIYKYTNDIIFEEDEEDDNEETMSFVSRNLVSLSSNNL